MLPEASPCAPISVALGRRDTADAQTEADAARVTFLREAISRIGTTLDLGHTARVLVTSAVPRFADFASVHLHDHVTAQDDASVPQQPPGSVVMHRVASAHTDDPGAGELHAERTFVYQADTAMARFLALVEPILIPRVDQDTLRQLPQELDSPAARSVLSGSSVMLVPLTVRGLVLGFMVFGRKPERLAFSPVDLAACQEMAEQAALSLDNARLYGHEARTSAVLQRSLLPTRPPRLPSVEIAYRYHPCSRTTQVGGDWLDVIPLPRHRVGLVIGDVAGHGLHAAVAMGQLRTAVRTLATMDLPPAQLLAHLDQLAQHLGHVPLTTCLYAIYDPIAGRAAFASAGHLPPVLLRPDGTDELLEIPVGAPIGVGSIAFDTLDVSIDSGSLLVLYTDGLVEARGHDIEEGLLAVRCGLAATHPSLDEACESLLRQQHPNGDHDDIAVLMARLHSIPDDKVATWRFPPQPQQVSVARRRVRDTLTAWGLDPLCDTTELLAGELLTNAIRHTTHPVGLRLVHTDTLLCEVTGDQQITPMLPHTPGTQASHCAITLLQKLATRWGCSDTSTGRTVWFESNLPAPASRATARRL